MSLSVAPLTKLSDAFLLNMENKELAAIYLADLLQKRKIFADLACEEPQTPPRSPLYESDSAHEERITTLRERVLEAYAKADGNPADGKWVFLSHLLRMGVTSGQGGRWAGARTDVCPADELNGNELHWINADTESQWKEWELRDREERILRDKVESWKRKLVAQQTPSSVVIPASGKISVASSTILQNAPEQPTISQNKTTSAGSRSRVKASNMEATSPMAIAPNSFIKAVPSSVDLLKDHSPFGFSVVKRPSQKSAAGKPAGPVKPKLSNKKPEPEQDSSFLVPRPHEPMPPNNNLDDPSTSTRGTNIHQIAADISSSFISPSFSSSAIITSTPKPETTAKSHKPNIPHAAPPPFQPQPLIPLLPPAKSLGGPYASSILEKAHRGQINPFEPAISLMIPTTSPTRHHHDLPSNLTSDIFSSNAKAPENHLSNNNNKRLRQPRSASPTSPRADTDGRALKKARTMPALMASPSRMKALPMDSSSSHIKNTARNAGGLPSFLQEPGDVNPLFDSPLASPPVTPKRPMLPTLTELLATTKKGKGPSPSRRALGKRRHLVPSQDSNSEADLPVKPKPPFPSPPRRFAAAAPVIDPYADDADFEAIIAANAAPPSSYNNPYKAQFDPYADIPLDGDASPAKSLSSLAGSDSEEDDELREHNFGHAVFGGLSPDLVFKPAAMSTQHGPFKAANAGIDRQDSWASVYGPATNSNSKDIGEAASRLPPSSGSLYPAYNSQFEADVARKVDTVSQLLEKDVDYAGWLRDPSPVPRPGMAMDDSP